MQRFSKLLSLLSLGLGLNACWLIFPPTDPSDTQTFSKQLTDPDGDGFMTSPECDPTMATPFCFWQPIIEDPGCVVSPNPGGCAAIQWEQTITIDETGWMWYDTCETCLDADGNPIGDTQCNYGESIPPVDCWQLDDTCWECVTPDGDGFVTCVEPIENCESDADCSDGETCIWYPDAECPPNALCAPDFGVGVCGVSDPDVYCNVNEECPDGYACVPNDNPPCEAEPCFFSEPFYAGICAPSQEGCASDADCNAGEVCGIPCENINGYCPIGDLTVIGECFPVAPAGCAESTTQNGCEENPACDWIPDPGVACFTEPCDFGTCVDAQPQPTDPCESHTDPNSCNADFNNFCGWVEDPTIVCVTEPCYQGSCHNLGCGDVANP